MQSPRPEAIKLVRNKRAKNNTVFLLFLVFFAVLAADLNAQETYVEKNDEQGIGRQFIDDGFYLLCSPTRMNRNDFLTLTAFVVVNVSLIDRVDQPFDQSFALAQTNSFYQPLEKLADVGDVYDQLGSKTVPILVTGSFLLTGWIRQDKYLLNTSLFIAESVLFTALLTDMTKRVFGRARPFTGRGAGDFSFMGGNSSSVFRSMPSGHTSTAVAMMTVIASRYPEWWVKTSALLISAGVAAQRADDRRHWLSDVVAGAAIGYWVSRTLLSQKRSDSNQLVVPIVTQQMIGVRISF